MGSSKPAPTRACTHELRALLGPGVIEQDEQVPLSVSAAAAVDRLQAFCPATCRWPVALAFALHDRAARHPDGLAGQPAAELSQRRSLGEQAIWQDAANGGGARWVIGYAGRFWRPTHKLAQPDWPGFVAWRQPGTARVAWQFSVQGSGGGRRPRLHLSMLAAGVDAGGHAALSAYLLAVGWASRRLRRALCEAAAQHCLGP